MRSVELRNICLAALALAACLLAGFGGYIAGYEIGYDDAAFDYRKKLDEAYAEVAGSRAPRQSDADLIEGASVTESPHD